MSEALHILQVDDDPSFLELALQRYRRGLSGVTVSGATDGEEALDRLRSGDVDCLVSDSLVLPSGDPFVAAAREVAPDVPVVLFTAKRLSDLEDDFQAVGFDEYVRKSGTDPLDTVVEHLGEILDRGGAETTPSSSFGPEWTVVAHHDWEATDELAVTVVDALADVTAADPMTGPPLYSQVDVEAVEDLLRPRAGPGRSQTSVRFGWNGVEVTITREGLIAVKPTAGS